jgi:hypothetical protein
MGFLAKLSLALLLAAAMAPAPLAGAAWESHPECCCEIPSPCNDASGKSPCACPVCPPAFPPQPLQSPRSDSALPPVPERLTAWSMHDESADDRRASPPVPPPRSDA